MKSQVSVEMLIIIAIFLGVVTPVFYFSFTQSADEIKLTQSRYVLNEIANAADYVYSLEVGTVTQLDIDVPEGITDSRVVGHTLVYEVSTTSGVSDVFSVTKADVYGELPVRSTRHLLTLNHTESGVYIV